MSTTILSREDPVSEALNGFAVISNPTLRFVVSRSPIFIVLLLLADALIGPRLFVRDIFRLSGVITAVIEIVVFSSLFSRVPEVLRAIWARKLVYSSVDGKTISDAYSQYVSKFGSALNSRFAWYTGVGFAIFGLFSTYMVRAWITYCSSKSLIDTYGMYCSERFDVSDWLSYYLWRNWGIAGPLIALLLGLLVWRAGVIALYMTRLSKQFALNTQFKHPDGTGGYRPFGDLCLLNALLIAIPALYFSIWSFLALMEMEPGGIDLSLFNELWSGLFRILFIILLNLAVVWAFFGPAYGVHQHMKRRRDENLVLLDQIGTNDSTSEDRNGFAEWQNALDSTRSELRNQLSESFVEDELKTLCFDLGVDHENVGGETKTDMAREIVGLFEREGRLEELVNYCRNSRPLLKWPSVGELDKAARLINMLPSSEQNLESSYQALTRTPVWPFTNRALLLVVVVQTVILGTLVGGIAASS